MITLEPFFVPPSGQASDPVLLGVSRGLSQLFEPVRQEDLPEGLAEIVRRLVEGEDRGEA
jgi:hypothetical protein